MESVVCDNCASNDTRLKYKIKVDESSLHFYRFARNIEPKDVYLKDYEVVTCKQCGLTYTNPRLDSNELNTLYSSNKILGGKWVNFPYLFDSSRPDELQDLSKKVVVNTKAHDYKFNIIKKFSGAPKGLKLLDVGCGDGLFVFKAQELGYDAFGIDLSIDRVNFGIKEFGLEGRLKVGDISSVPSGVKYDVITLWDVFEHLPSPSKMLQNLRDISHSNTRIYILTMSMTSNTYRLYGKRWYYFVPTQHLYFFNHKTIEMVFNKNGFNLEGIEMDHTKHKTFIHLMFRIIVGALNNFFFEVYAGNLKFLRFLFKPFHWGISNSRMAKRLENLFPGAYFGRFKDNFVFVGKPK